MQLFDHSLWTIDLSLLGVGSQVLPEHYSFSSLLFHIPHVDIDTTAFGLFRLKKWSESHSVVSDSLRPHGVYSPWNSPSQNSGVGSRSLLQGIFPTQESNWGLLQCRQILYQLSYHTYKQSSLNLAQSLNELRGFTLTLSSKGKINPDRKMKNHPQLLISYKQCLAFGQATRLIK